MKLLLYSSLIIFFNSCNHKSEDKKTKIEFKYSSYTWRLSREKWKMEFYLANYLSVDKDGKFKLMRHTIFMDTPQYFYGIFSSSIQEVIDTILMTNRFSGTTDTTPILYDGFAYCLDYKIEGKNRNKIQYMNASEKAPENILYLTMLLDRFIAQTYKNKIDSFSIGKYLDTLITISSDKNQVPPPPKRPPQPPTNQIKFISPK